MNWSYKCQRCGESYGEEERDFCPECDGFVAWGCSCIKPLTLKDFPKFEEEEVDWGKIWKKFDENKRGFGSPI